MIGIMLANRYEIIEKIGEGGMAIVYKAKCHLLNRFVAVKVLRNEFTEDEDFIRKFRRESQAAASLSHPNILNIYDVGYEEIEDKKIHYIVMEFINGKTLKEVIKASGKLTLDDTINYSMQIAEALMHAHRNHIVHRDIKPHNIMITEDERVKVTDFGIARAVTSSTVTTTSNVLGSVHYFSPEQARGGYTDEKSDIYSLGIVMYEMITGKVPFEGDSPISIALKHIQEDITPPREVDSTVPAGLEAIILKCIEKRQSDRYNSISELIVDLRKIKNNVPVNIERDMDETRIIAPIAEDEEVPVRNNKKKPAPVKSSAKGAKKKKESSKGGTGVIVLGIVMAFLLVTGMFYGYSKLRGALKADDDIVMPNILGEQEENARKKIEDLGLVFNVTDRINSSEYEEGQVMHQSVDEGIKVKKDYPVNVTISLGQESVKVPLVMNLSLEEAEKLITDAKLNVGTVKEGFSDTIPEGMVIEQKPDALEAVAPGTRVDLVLSQGAEVKIITMPKLVDKTINEAKQIIADMGLEVGDVTPQPSESVEKDRVIWQSYEAGTSIETGTAVDLYISQGPAPEPEPEEIPDAEVVTQITINIPQDKDETEVKINRIQDGVTATVYNKTHKAEEGYIVVPLSGKPGVTYEIFYDGEYIAPFPGALQ